MVCDIILGCQNWGLGPKLGPMRTSLKSLITIATFSAAAQASSPKPELVAQEVPVTNIFAPAVGYDDNDLVQLVVEGNLPNGCYRQDRTSISTDLATHTINVVQFATRLSDGVCEKADAELSPELKRSVHFMNDVNVGVLEVGEYHVAYNVVGGQVLRPLAVAKAPVTTIDSLHYAHVHFAFVQDQVDSSQKTMRVEFSGLLSSSCVELEDVVPAQLVDDVLILMPQITVSDDICMPVERRFMKEIDVVVPKTPGRYMLHVRSSNGEAVNRLFSVK